MIYKIISCLPRATNNKTLEKKGKEVVRKSIMNYLCKKILVLQKYRN